MRGRSPCPNAKRSNCFSFLWYVSFLFALRSLKEKRNVRKKQKSQNILRSISLSAKKRCPKKLPEADFRSLFACNCSFPKIFNSHFVLKHEKFLNGNFANSKYSLQYARVILIFEFSCHNDFALFIISVFPNPMGNKVSLDII